MSTLSQFFSSTGSVKAGPPGNLRFFTSSTPSTTIPANVEYIAYAVLGGGGGGPGGRRYPFTPTPSPVPISAAEGSGGGFSYNEGPVTGPFSASVTVGAGGTGGGLSFSPSPLPGAAGGTSSISGIPLGTISATGGGAGAGSGGSGSGGLFNSSGAPGTSPLVALTGFAGGAGGIFGPTTDYTMAVTYFNTEDRFLAQFTDNGNYSHMKTFFAPTIFSASGFGSGGGSRYNNPGNTPGTPGGFGGGGGQGASARRPQAGGEGGNGGPGFAAIEFWNK